MTTTSIHKPTEAPASGPIRCASWCEQGDGHSGARLKGDQWCSSIGGTVTASLGESLERCDGSSQSAEVGVYASQDPGEAAFVALVDPDGRGTNLTPGEARELARQLNHFGWVAEQV